MNIYIYIKQIWNGLVLQPAPCTTKCLKSVSFPVSLVTVME